MRGNRQNTGVSPLVGFNFTPNGRSPILAWADTNQDVDTNQDGLSLINATPVIGAGDVVYVGSSNKHFYSFSPRAEQQPVKVSVHSIVDSAGCFISPDLLYFPCGDFSLYQCAADLKSMTPHRMQSNGGSPSTIDWFEGNVVADVNNRLYAGCDNFCLYCCTPGEKYPLWLFPTGFFVWSACAFSTDNTTAYFASADMTLYALDLSESGVPREKWTFPIPNLCTSSPAVDNQNVVYFGAFDGAIYALDGSSGDKRWAYQTGSLIYASPAITDDGVLYLISSDGVLRALDTQGPTLLWEFFTGMPSFSSAALGPDPEQKAKYLIYVGTGNGEVLALDPNGNRRWSFDISTLYPQNSDPNDPAFWSSFRYPAINSSLAIGSNGIATATSGGLILWIDYLYYTKSPLPAGINVSPLDDYVNQLGDGDRFCYISPAGRMAETVLQPSQPIQVYPAEAITLTLLHKKAYGTNQTRSSFATLPQNLQLSSKDGAKITWRESADETQLYIYPISAPASTRTITVSDANGQNLVQFIVHYRTPPADPLSQTALLSQKFVIQQMSFYAPFVVPALDQLGIATISIPFRAVDFTGPSGSLWAYGYESYNEGAAGAPVRNLLYVFTGTYQDGNLILDSTPSYFELTGFPSPIDTLKVTGMVTADSKAHFIGLSLLAEYTETTTSLLNWLCTYLTHWFDTDIPGGQTICDFLREADGRADEIDRVSKQPEDKKTAPNDDSLDIWERILYFLGRLASNFGPIMADWKLFNSASQFTWAGTYSLGTDSLPAPALPRKTSFNYDENTFTFTARLEFSQKIPSGLVVGIVILGSDGVPLMHLNYTDRNQPPTINGNGTTLSQDMDLTGVTLSGCKALVFVNLEKLPQEYVF